MICAYQLQHLFNARETAGAVKTGKPISDIGRHAQVREKSGLLSDKRCLASAGLQTDARCRVGQRVLVQRDAPSVRQVQSGDQTKQRALARA